MRAYTLSITFKATDSPEKLFRYFRFYFCIMLDLRTIKHNVQGLNICKFIFHCVKSVRIQSYSSPYFLAFGLNTQKYSVPLRIQSKCGKMLPNECLVPNKTEFVSLWPQCILSIISTNQSHKLEKSLSSCFAITVLFLCLKTMQV